MSGLYEQAFRHVFYPAYESGFRRRGTLAWLSEYERSQWLSPEQLAALQWDRLKRLLEHCHREVPYYRRRWRELGVTPADIRSMDDYARLPLLTREEMCEHREELKADSWRDRLLYKQTGGTTGEPMTLGYTRESHDRRIAVMWRGYAWAGSRMGRRTMYLWGHLGEDPRAQRWKERLYNAALARRMVNSFHMSEANMAEYAQAVDDYRPDILVGYVSALVRLAEWLEATGRRVHRPQAILCCAETLHEFQRDLIERAFGTHAYNTYGCREVMLIASECEHRHGLHINVDHLVIELEKPAHALPDARTGEVVITDLFNYGMPLLRYVNGDMATAATGSCPCGRGLPLLSRVDGRVVDMIRTPDGRSLPGVFFPYLMGTTEGVTGFQLIQRRLDRLDLTVARGEGFNDDSVARIRHEIQKALGDGIELELHLVDKIPLTRSGKTRLTISELSS
ncbi:phenylacetate--CoA ligase family protein [Dyella soli]|uniref:Phenylacetate--CoA ligase family protein n=1 Tax=Dyella soli TaxID=522319 RepID=A0A4R0YVS3_9GAMM|nr:phenylacetate--CoA ligase family protein [Dyella soli]TCI10450.1 phenylacetate--CoA ligase family protein [Dyella soli]